jgi:hypothetical protein
VINLNILNQLISDRELRSQVARLLSNKVRVDIKSLETNGLLSRRLMELAARSKNGEQQAERSALRGLIKEHLDFYDLLLNQTLAFNQRLTERLNGLGAPAHAPDSVVTMSLAAPPDSLVRSPFRLENNRSTAISIGFEVTPFVSESGHSIVSAEVAFDPPSLELKPGQEARIELVLAVTREFVPGNTYLATVTVKGLEATQLLLRLHIETAKSEPARSAAAEASAGPTDQAGEATPAKRPRAKKSATGRRAKRPRNAR